MDEVKGLFNSFREAGFVAMQDFECCAGCGATAMGTLIQGMLEQGRPLEDIKGYVFYHHQDSHTLWHDGVLNLRYGQYTDSHSEPVIRKSPLTDKEVGDALVEIVKARNIFYQWEGDPARTIQLKFDAHHYGYPEDDVEGDMEDW